jgi:hypothetical protein
MLRSGSSLAEVDQVLRHRNLFTTGMYAKVDHVSLSEVAQSWPGAAWAPCAHTWTTTWPCRRLGFKLERACCLLALVLPAPWDHPLASDGTTRLRVKAHQLGECSSPNNAFDQSGGLL